MEKTQYPFQKNGCNCTSPTDEFHGWECSITGGACMFLCPSAEKCAHMYGEGPLSDVIPQDYQYNPEPTKCVAICKVCGSEFESYGNMDMCEECFMEKLYGQDEED